MYKSTDFRSGALSHRDTMDQANQEVEIDQRFFMEKLFLAIEIERLRGLVDEKESDNDKLALINDKLDTNLQKKSIETKELQ